MLEDFSGLSLYQAMKILNEHYRKYVRHRFSNAASLKNWITILQMREKGYTLRKIGEIICRSPERIRQIEGKIYFILRKHINSLDLGIKERIKCPTKKNQKAMTVK